MRVDRRVVGLLQIVEGFARVIVSETCGGSGERGCGY
jgi:hypothetical protein